MLFIKNFHIIKKREKKKKISVQNHCWGLNPVRNRRAVEERSLQVWAFCQWRALSRHQKGLCTEKNETTDWYIAETSQQLSVLNRMCLFGTRAPAKARVTSAEGKNAHSSNEKMNTVKNYNLQHLQEPLINYITDKSITERRRQKEVTLKPIKFSGKRGPSACLSQIPVNLRDSEMAVAQSTGRCCSPTAPFYKTVCWTTHRLHTEENCSGDTVFSCLTKVLF